MEDSPERSAQWFGTSRAALRSMSIHNIAPRPARRTPPAAPTSESPSRPAARITLRGVPGRPLDRAEEHIGRQDHGDARAEDRRARDAGGGGGINRFEAELEHRRDAVGCNRARRTPSPRAASTCASLQLLVRTRELSFSSASASTIAFSSPSRALRAARYDRQWSTCCTHALPRGVASN